MLLRIRLRCFRHTRIANFSFALIALIFILLSLSSSQILGQTQPKPADASGTTQDKNEVRRLEQGKPIELELKGGEVHVYEVTVTAAQYFKALVEQRGIDVQVTVFAPDGKQLAKVDSPNGTHGTELVAVVADVAGNYRLEVGSLEKNAKPGVYKIKLTELRVATPQDKELIAAQQEIREKNIIAAEEAFNQGMRLIQQGTAVSMKAAILKCEEALRLWQILDDHTMQGLALIVIGRIHGDFGDLKKAVDYNNQALNLSQATADRQGEATALNNLGQLYSDLGDQQKALDFLSQSLKLRQQAGNPGDQAVVLNKIGMVHFSLGDSQKALDFLDQASKLRRQANDRRGESITLGNVAFVYSETGENQKAIDLYLNKVLPLAQQVDDKRGLAALLNNIGLNYWRLSEYQKALDFFNQALPLRKESGDRGGESDTLNNIGLVYSSLNENRNALDYFRQALQLIRAVGNPKKISGGLANIGMIHSNLGEHQKALDFLNQALEMEISINDRQGSAVTLNNIGLVHERLGNKPKAMDFYNQSLKVTQSIGDRNGEALSYSNIGGLYRSLGEHQKALDYYNQALPLTRLAGRRTSEGAILYSIASVELNRGNLNEARTQIESALAITESLRTGIVNQSLRSSYFATVKSYYDFYIDLLMRLHRERPSENFNASALQAAERARARSLLETLVEARADIRQGIDPQLLEHERTLQRQLNTKAKALSGKNTEEQVTTIKKELDKLTTELQQAQAEIRQKSPRYAALTQPQPLSLKEIQTQVLDSDTVLLEYALGKDKSYLWAVTTDSITSYELPKRTEIEAAALRYYKLLTERNRRTDSVAGETNAQKLARIEKDNQRFAQADAQLPDAANKLSQMLLSPLAAQLGEKRLLIVADGALQYVPFAALPEPASTSPANNTRAKSVTSQPLVVNHEIVSLPSASTLAVLRREVKGRMPAPNMVAVLADPVFSKDEPHFDEAVGLRKSNDAGKSSKIASAVPSTSASVVRALQETGIAARGGSIPRLDATQREANSILALVPKGEGIKRLDFDASRATVESGELARYQIVHFATHGFLNSEHPELSGIVLSLVDERGEPQDGFIRLHEIYNLKLPAELVVLSACQTALGKEIKGEGLVGLTRGFMYAGAPRVVASLWQVDDAATRELMQRFYRAMLTDKLRPAAALRRAQIEMAKQRTMGKPYNWAAFVLQGEWK